MIKVNDKKRDITDAIWSVITAFGYQEVEYTEGLLNEVKEAPGKYCYFEKDTICAINTGKKGINAKTELLAMGIEVAAALNIEYFYAQVGDEDVMNLSYLFGFEGIVEKGTQKDEILLAKDGVEFASGRYGEDALQIFFDVEKIIDALVLSGEDVDSAFNSATLLFAEKNAEGVAYEVAYNLRINGCIVEFFTDGEDISNAESYADKKGLSCIIRAFPDGRLMIKDDIKNEIIETCLDDFLGYYDDEPECDCGHHHHHGEDCNCH